MNVRCGQNRSTEDEVDLMLEHIFGSDVKTSSGACYCNTNRSSHKPLKVARVVKNLEFQFIRETGSNRGPRQYDRSRFTQQCIQRSKPRPTRRPQRVIASPAIALVGWNKKIGGSQNELMIVTPRKKWPIPRKPRKLQAVTATVQDDPGKQSNLRIRSNREGYKNTPDLLEQRLSNPSANTSYDDGSDDRELSIVPRSESYLRTIIGEGTVNPFPTAYPVQCVPEDHALLDHYLNWKYIYGYPDLAQNSPFSSVLQDCLTDAASFHLLLAQSAYSLIALKGVATPPLALVHKIAGIRLINERLSDPALATCDENIMAATTMVSIENRFGSEVTAAIHLQGLQTMISLRGGVQGLSFREQRRIYFRASTYPAQSSEVKLGDVRKNSVFILQTPTYTTKAARTSEVDMSTNTTWTPRPTSIKIDNVIKHTGNSNPALRSPTLASYLTCSTSSNHDLLEADSSIHPHTRSYQQYTQCEEFLTYLTAYTNLSLVRHRSLPSHPQTQSTRPYFTSSSPIYRLFTSPHPQIYPEAPLVKESALITCLLILHSTIYSLRHSQRLTTTFVARIDDDLRGQGLVSPQAVSIEFLLWVLLSLDPTEIETGTSTPSGSADTDQFPSTGSSHATARERWSSRTRFERMETVLRLVSTMRRLGPRTWMIVRESLIAGLVGSLGWIRRASAMWSVEGLREEILRQGFGGSLGDAP